VRDDQVTAIELEANALGKRLVEAWRVQLGSGRGEFHDGGEFAGAIGAALLFLRGGRQFPTLADQDMALRPYPQDRPKSGGEALPLEPARNPEFED
jgi:hypothetical protein